MLRSVIKDHEGSINGICRIWEDKPLYCTYSGDGTYKIRNLENLKKPQILSNIKDHTGSVRFVKNNKTIICSYSNDDNNIVVRDL